MSEKIKKIMREFNNAAWDVADRVYLGAREVKRKTKEAVFLTKLFAEVSAMQIKDMLMPDISVCILKGKTDRLEKMLKADPDLAKKPYKTPAGYDEPLLMLAAQEPTGRSLRVLLENWVDIKDQPTDGFTPLRLAIAYDRPEVVKVLAEYKDPDLNLSRGREKTTALMDATSRAMPDMVRLLVDLGADVCARDADGLTADMRVKYLRDLCGKISNPDAETLSAITRYTEIETMLLTLRNAAELKSAPKAPAL